MMPVTHRQSVRFLLRGLALFLACSGGKLAASSYDYAYGSMAHYNERSREQALDRMSAYSPNSSSRSSGGMFDGYIAQMRENDRREEQRQNEERRYRQQNASTGNTLLDNYHKYMRLHPEQASAASVAVDARTADEVFFAQTSQRARAGSADDMYMLGYLYHDGKSGVPVNRAQALAWYEKAATAGHHDAINWAWYMHSAGDGVPENKERALFWRRKLADSGDAEAERDIGVRFLKGSGLPRDPAEGLRYLNRAAAQGDEYALQALGEAYADRDGPAYDLAKARLTLRSILGKTPTYAFYDNVDLLLKLSDEAGLSKAQITEELVTVLGPVAATSDKVASRLGGLFLGKNGVPEDDVLAAKYFEMSAALGSPYSPDQLIVLYKNKDSAAYSPAKALVHLRRQLERQPDYDFSLYVSEYRRLSRETGQTAAAVEAELRQCLTLAVKTRPVASYCLAQLIDDGPTRASEAQAVLELYRQAAGQPPSDCQTAAALRLYEIYRRGDLVPADAALAASWLQRADGANTEVSLYKAGVALRDGAVSEPVKAFLKFADHGFYDAARTPVHELSRRAALAMLKSELAHSKDPAGLVLMLRTVRFGDAESEMGIWTVEEEVRVTLRFPDYYDKEIDDALGVLRWAAQKGRASAYHWLAVSEARVLGPTESAIEYARQGAEAGDLDCKGLLGLWRWETSGGKDLSCVALLEAAAKGGIDDALFNLARVYEVGDSSVRDEMKARELYGQAAEVGISAAKRQLGTMWAEGRGGAQDRAQGFALLRAAAVDDRGAAFLLGGHLVSGDWGERDAVAGCEALKSALAMGEWRAGIQLAWTYRTGEGVPVDDGAARAALRAAGEAAKRDRGAFTSEAHQQIGQAFWHGTCVPADPVEALKWLPEGLERSLAYRTGTGATPHFPTAESSARQLEDLGDVRGTLELGEIALAQGKIAEAQEYFDRAAQAGNVTAAQHLVEYWTATKATAPVPNFRQIYEREAIQLAGRSPPKTP